MFRLRGARRWRDILIGPRITHVRLLPQRAADQDDYSPEAIASRRGTDLRLVPIALATWAVVCATVIVRNTVPSLCAGGLGLIGAMVLLQPSRARGAAAVRRDSLRRTFSRTIFSAGIVSGALGALCWWRIILIASHPWFSHPDKTIQQQLRVASLPRQVDNGAVMMTVSAPGMGPANHVPLFFTSSHAQSEGWRALDVQPGDSLEVAFRVEESGRAEVIPCVLRATRSVAEVHPGEGWWSVSRHLRQGLNHAASLMPAESGAIVPGMVVGDTSAQSPLLQDQLLRTGLSHLSAVSGANCAIVMGAAMVVASACGAARWGKIISSAVALIAFVAVVGLEPSVLRAAVMGSLGVVAVATSLWRDIVASACWAVLGMLLWDPGLAVNYGFLLSLVATLGIVILAPWWSTRILGRWWRILEKYNRRPPEWHGLFVRLVCVSIAADVVTAPLIMHMAGRYSLTVIPANILVSWAVPIVTIVGLVLAFAGAAADVVSFSGISDSILFILGLPAAPSAGWIQWIARVLSSAPVLTAPSGNLSAACMICLVVLIVLSSWRRTRWARLAWGPVLICGAGLMRWGSVGVEYTDPAPRSMIFDAEGYTPIHVPSDDAALRITPEVATLIINDSCGPPTPRPSITPAGIPVLYPCRDGTQIVE